jgi:hypothetical protein
MRVKDGGRQIIRWFGAILSGLDDLGWDRAGLPSPSGGSAGSLWVESEDEIRASLLGTDTECIDLGVERYFGRGANLDRFSSLSNEIDERADRCGTNVEAFQDFLVLGENILRAQPHKVFLVRPAME